MRAGGGHRFLAEHSALIEKIESRVLGVLRREQLDKLIHRQAGVSDYAPEGAETDLPVVGNHNTRVRVVAAKDHMAARLAAELEAGAFESRADLASGQTGWELGHAPAKTRRAAYAASTSTNSFPASVGTGSPASRQSST